MYDFPRITEFAIPFFVLAMLVELWMIRTHRANGSFETRDTLTSLMMGTGNVVAGLLLGIVSFSALMWVWQFRVFDLGTSVDRRGVRDVGGHAKALRGVGGSRHENPFSSRARRGSL